MSKTMARVLAGVLAAAALVPLIGAQAQAATHSTRITWASARVVRWVDGDTVQTTRGDIRLIGVDTPEHGRPGAATATIWANHLAPRGSVVRMGNPASVQDNDRYGRHLRYVVSAHGVDVDRAQIAHGARARYDDRDGYAWHPREADYRRVDAAHPNYRGGWSTPAAHVSHRSTGGAHAGSGTTCPHGYPVKGNDNSGIYQMPYNRYYSVTNARHCYASAAAAAAAGYRAAKI